MLIWKEQNLFEFLRDNVVSDISYCNGKYSFSDCISYINNWRIELKCRHRHYNLLLIEKEKYDHLICVANQNKQIPIYVCSTPRGVWLFNLQDIFMDWFVQNNLPVTTQFGNNDKICKIVGYLDINKGVCLTEFENNNTVGDWL